MPKIVTLKDIPPMIFRCDGARAFGAFQVLVAIIVIGGCDRPVNPAQVPVNSLSGSVARAGAAVAFELDSETEFVLHIRDPELIARMITEPLTHATIETRHAAYKVLGSIELDDGSGGRSLIILFSPWGHVRRGDEYCTADLKELAEFLVSKGLQIRSRVDVEARQE